MAGDCRRERERPMRASTSSRRGAPKRGSGPSVVSPMPPPEPRPDPPMPRGPHRPEPHGPRGSKELPRWRWSGKRSLTGGGRSLPDPGPSPCPESGRGRVGPLQPRGRGTLSWDRVGSPSPGGRGGPWRGRRLGVGVGIRRVGPQDPGLMRHVKIGRNGQAIRVAKIRRPGGLHPRLPTARR